MLGAVSRVALDVHAREADETVHPRRPLLHHAAPEPARRPCDAHERLARRLGVLDLGVQVLLADLAHLTAQPFEPHRDELVPLTTHRDLVAVLPRGDEASHYLFVSCFYINHQLYIA